MPSPTADLREGLGPTLLRDTFDDPSPWALSTSPSSGAGIRDGRLTLAIRAPRVYHFTRRLPPGATDFYAEIDVFTEVCSPGDEFGLMVRNNSLGEHYRFVIGCDGTARISRALETGSRALTLWTASPAVIPGAPSINRLGVWANGLDLKLLVNGTEVIAARDSALAQGSFGVVARAGPAGQVAVSFDNLIVRGLRDPRASPTAAPTPPP
ncbi:MAG TPA: hypothetical protein VLL77_01040 [Anaerolineales bacterium]|nr:hypothetical protein [Anaerolineales bacterium]